MQFSRHKGHWHRWIWKLRFWTKLSIPHDFYCQEGTKNVSFVSVRNIEGQNRSGHTVQGNLSLFFFMFILELLGWYLKMKDLTRIKTFISSQKYFKKQSSPFLCIFNLWKIQKIWFTTDFYNGKLISTVQTFNLNFPPCENSATNHPIGLYEH